MYSLFESNDEIICVDHKLAKRNEISFGNKAKSSV